MTAIRFPNSVGIGSSNSRTDLRHDGRGIKAFNKTVRGSDVIEISSEAKNRFEKDNLVKLEKVRLFKEALKYRVDLNSEIKFSEGDLRNIHRLNRITDVKEKMKNGFYDVYENSILEKIIDKQLI